MRDRDGNKLMRYEFVKQVFSEFLPMNRKKKLFKRLNTRVLTRKKSDFKLAINYNLKHMNIQF